jgi:hypothetical protein
LPRAVPPWFDRPRRTTWRGGVEDHSSISTNYGTTSRRPRPGHVASYAATLRQEVVRPQQTIREVRPTAPLSAYGVRGGLPQDVGRVAELPTQARTCGHGRCEVRVLLSAYGSRGGVDPVVELAVRLRAPGAEVRVCAPPDYAAAEGGDALAATSVVPTGGWP